MPATTERQWTPDELHAFMEEHPERMPRYELVHGELLVTPSPGWPHQRIVRDLLVQLHAYLQASDVGEVMISPLAARRRR